MFDCAVSSDFVQCAEWRWMALSLECFFCRWPTVEDCAIPMLRLQFIIGCKRRVVANLIGFLQLCRNRTYWEMAPKPDGLCNAKRDHQS